MKKLLILIILSGLGILKAQNFEGIIMYSNSYQSKVENIESKMFNDMMGTRQAYVIKGGNYKSVFNGKFTKMQIYRGDENMSYTLTVKSDTMYWEDYSQNNDKSFKYEIKKEQEIILGIPCDVIIVQSEKSTTHFYYNKKYKVDVELFAQHNYGNWFYIISKTKALPLKTVLETDQFILTSIATKVTVMELEDKAFEINKNKIAKANW